MGRLSHLYLKQQTNYKCMCMCMCERKERERGESNTYTVEVEIASRYGGGAHSAAWGWGFVQEQDVALWKVRERPVKATHRGWWLSTRASCVYSTKGKYA
jgi:hypothetical protein